MYILAVWYTWIQQTASIPLQGGLSALSNHAQRTVSAWYSGTLSWLATGSRDQRRSNEDQWAVADPISVDNVAASHRFHYRADGGNASTRDSGLDSGGEDAPVLAKAVHRGRRQSRRFRVVGLIGVLAVFAVVASTPPAHLATTGVGFAAAAIPTPAHVIIVVEENRSQADIIGNKSAPYINALAAKGAMMTQSFGETHPSQPNYLALFAGSTFGVKDDCPVNGGAATPASSRCA